MPAQRNESGEVSYTISLGNESIEASDCLEKKVTLSFIGEINCIHCGRKTKKSFSQGYCFPCMKSLAQCDQCIMSPERCHYAAGTCREPEWGEQFCMTDHIVYLANTTAAKVGLTRGSQIPTRWIDQGAEQALPIMRVKTRQQAGFIEDALRAHIADKTNWRNMLKGSADPLALIEKKQELFDLCKQPIEDLYQRFGAENFVKLDEQEVVDLKFPVLHYPEKISSFNLDKVPQAEGVLMGIKGQYLILDTGVINLRKYTGYQLQLVVD